MGIERSAGVDVEVVASIAEQADPDADRRFPTRGGWVSLAPPYRMPAGGAHKMLHDGRDVPPSESSSYARMGISVARERGIYSLVDLFAGCGGLSLGFESAGFTPVFVNELNPDALATYLANRFHALGGEPFATNEALRCADVNELEGHRLDRLRADLHNLREADIKFPQPERGEPTLDVLAGGPPCQGFSEIGKRRSYAVDRQDLPSNRLYLRMADVVDALRPRIFLFENVRGLLHARWTHGGPRAWDDVLARFMAIEGYHVRWSLVWASDYGVPQLRPRVLLVGIRRDIAAGCASLDLSADDAVEAGFLPAPRKVDTPPDLIDVLGDLVDPAVGEVLDTGNYPAGRFETTSYPSPAATEMQQRLRRPPPSGALSTETGLLTDQEYSRHSRHVVRRFRHIMDGGTELPPELQTRKFSQRALPARWGEQGPTVTATSLPDDYVHFAQPRILTVREWARLQLFPDWYRFRGKRTTGGLRRAGNPREGIFDREVPKYTQVGNAVPVGLAERVGERFHELLDEALGPR